MSYTEEEINLIVADSFSELHYKYKKCFLAAQRDDEESQKYADALIKSLGVGVYNKLKEKFYDGEYRKNLLSLLDKKRVECVTFKSTDYPDSLKHIPVPPLVLYIRGNRELLGQRKFCIVGSRKSTAQALEVCKNISEKLSEHFVITTGVADGADSAAACGALPSGKVICVLPFGHGRANGVLKKVEDNGLSVSEFPPDTPALRYMFTARNRILAGLSDGVLVVSARQKGGALSTAGYAVDYGKDVFAFPYGIGVVSGIGCNKLIKSGAYLCDCIEDIYSVMGIESKVKDGGESDLPLDDDEKAVLSLLKEHGEMHAEKLAAATGKRAYELSAICSSLEIKGLLVRTGGNKFAAL